MRIKNMTGKTLKTYFHLPGWDPREDVISPGETTDEWFDSDEDDILKIREIGK